jgi:hypothetical protein
MPPDSDSNAVIVAGSGAPDEAPLDGPAKIRGFVLDEASARPLEGVVEPTRVRRNGGTPRSCAGRGGDGTAHLCREAGPSLRGPSPNRFNPATRDWMTALALLDRPGVEAAMKVC